MPSSAKKSDWSAFGEAFENSNPLKRRAWSRWREQQRLRALEAELKSWNSKCEQLEAERASLSEEISGLETDCEMYEEGIAAYESDLRDLNAV